MPKTSPILWFKDIDKDDIPFVGGKGANLGEMVTANFPVPNGFVITAQAYFAFLKEHNLTLKINHLLQTIDHNRPDSLQQVSSHIKKLIIGSKMGDELAQSIFKAYRELSGTFTDAYVAVRSSATAEDLPGASFAGQQETFLNVHGEANLALKVKDAWASLFEPRAIFYRHEQKYDHFQVGIAIVVQKMVNSDKSGIMFTIDPVTNSKSTIVVEAIDGLGEVIVQGQVTPDHYEVDKSSMEIKDISTAVQNVKLVKEKGKNKEIKMSEREGKKQKLTSNQILAVASLGKQLERHYYFPQDIEWAIEDGKVYIVQTRPITTTESKKSQEKQEKITLPLLLKGAPASPGIASGPVKILKSPKDIGLIMPGDVLVAPQTNPDFVPAMKKASAIVTDKGGRTSHAAIVSRELGIPAIVGTETATSILKNEMVITVNGGLGEVYKGGYTKTTTTVVVPQSHTKTATKVYVNLAQPDIASKVALKNVDGIGLLRAEFIMANIGTHPKKMIRDGKKKEYIEKLADSLTAFCEPFNPRPVVYRTSDFKTNEYRGLVGGKEYEPVEPNPMLGYRGAFRYMHDPEVFELELEAIKIVRNERNFKNLSIMLPFVRTVHELNEVKKILSHNKLHRSPSFKLWMMVEIPSNVIMLEKFIEAGIDGVSIGSNDLTMLLLGTDRDNSEVAQEFDEMNPTVLWALEHIIKTAHKYKITSSICGQAPSMYPELVDKLVNWGITSVSVSPDVVDTVRETIVKAEKKMLGHKE